MENLAWASFDHRPGWCYKRFSDCFGKYRKYRSNGKGRKLHHRFGRSF